MTHTLNTKKNQSLNQKSKRYFIAIDRMTDREYIKLNSSIQTASNSSGIKTDSEGNLEACIELSLPDSIFNPSAGNRHVDSVSMQTSKMRLSMENTPIAQIPLEPIQRPGTVSSSCQMDVYPFCLLDDGAFKPTELSDTCVPNYKQHIYTLNVVYYKNNIAGTDIESAGEFSYPMCVANDSIGIDDVILPSLIKGGVFEQINHIMNLCAQSNHEPFKIEDNNLYVNHQGTLEQMLQDALENAITYASCESYSTFNIRYWVDFSDSDTPSPAGGLVIPNRTNYFKPILPRSVAGHKAYFIDCTLDTEHSYTRNDLCAATKPKVSFTEQSMRISYDTAPFKNVPILWNTPFVETWDRPEQITLDTVRSSSLAQPPPKRVYRYDVLEDETEHTYAFTLPTDRECAPLNLITNEEFKNTFSFLPWIKVEPDKQTQIAELPKAKYRVTYRSSPTREVTKTIKTRTLGSYNSASTGTKTGPFYVRAQYLQHNNIVGGELHLSFRVALADDAADPLTIPTSKWRYATWESGYNVWGGLHIDNFDFRTLDVFPTTTTETSTIVDDSPAGEISFYTNDRSLPVGRSVKTVRGSESTPSYSWTRVGEATSMVKVYRTYDSNTSTGTKFILGINDCYSLGNSSGSWERDYLYPFKPDRYTRSATSSSATYHFYYNAISNLIFSNGAMIFFKNNTGASGSFAWYDLEQSVHYTEYEIETIVEELYADEEDETDFTQRLTQSSFNPNMDMGTSESMFILDGTTASLDIGPQEVVDVNTSEDTSQSYALITQSCSSKSQQFYRNRKIEGTLNIGYNRNYTASPTFGEAICGINSYTPGAEMYYHVPIGTLPTDVEAPTVQTDADFFVIKRRYDSTTQTYSPWEIVKNPTYTSNYLICENNDKTPTPSTDVLDTGILDSDPTITFMDDSQTEYSVSESAETPGTSIETTTTSTDAETINKGFATPTVQLQRVAFCLKDLNWVTANVEWLDNGKWFVYPSSDPDLSWSHEITDTSYVDYYQAWQLENFDVLGTQAIGNLKVEEYGTLSYYIDIAPEDKSSITTTTTTICKPLKVIAPSTVGNTRLTFTWSNLPVVVLSPISSIVLTLQGMQVGQEIQPINMTTVGGASLTTSIPVIENYYSLAQSLRDLHDELVVVKDQFDDTATYTLANTGGQERSLILRAQYITKDGKLHQLYIPPNGVFSIQITFGLSYYFTS